MRVSCSLGCGFWEPAPGCVTLGGVPLVIHREVINCLLEAEVAPQLKDHYCTPDKPCVVVRKAFQSCVPILSVCQTWKEIASAKMKASYIPCLHRTRLGGRYLTENILESGDGMRIYTAQDYGGSNGCHGTSRVVIKRTLNSTRNLASENEIATYKWLSRDENYTNWVAQFHYGGLIDFSYSIVLTELGLDLGRLRLHCCRDHMFTPKMTLAVAIQTIRIYKWLHAQDLLHCNAKPSNFVIGSNSSGQNTRIFAIDFEYSKRKITSREPRTDAKLTGWNYRFQPVSWEFDLTPSFRDDMEGLAYVLSYLERGRLPWDDVGQWRAWSVKICTTSKILFEGMNPVYVQYFDQIKALAWGEAPDYDQLCKSFVEVWEKSGYGGTPGEYDWWSELTPYPSKVEHS